MPKQVRSLYSLRTSILGQNSSYGVCQRDSGPSRLSSSYSVRLRSNVPKSFLERVIPIARYPTKRSTSYHPQTDGQTEVVNKCLELYLRCFYQEKSTTWSDKIVWVEYWYNTNYQSLIKNTPYAVVYGRPPPPIISYGQASTTPNDLVEY